MKKTILSLLTIALAFVGIDAVANLQTEKALVYCPTSDATGCEAIVTALRVQFPDGVDRAYDGTNGTLNLRKASAQDIAQYKVIVVPSLADFADQQPYGLLREEAVAGKVREALKGVVMVYSGQPDVGTRFRAQKDELIQNLVTSAAERSHGATGLVAFLDQSDNAFSWLKNVADVRVAATKNPKIYGELYKNESIAEEVMPKLLPRFRGVASFGLVVMPGTVAEVVARGADGAALLVAFDRFDHPQFSMSMADDTVARVVTDKEDYSPGEVVTVMGTGFLPGETVNMTLIEDPLWHGQRTLSAVAGEDGTFVDQSFSPEPHDLGVTFTLTATGATSGRVAVTTFTDGSINGSSSVISTHLTDCSTPALTSFTANQLICARVSINVSANASTTPFTVRWYLNDVEKTEFRTGATIPANTDNFVHTTLQTPTESGSWTIKLCASGVMGELNCTNASPKKVFAFTVTAATASNVIAWPQTLSATYGDAPITLTATSTSGTVTYTASGSCSVAGNTLTITGAGSCTVTASSPASSGYDAATDVQKTFTVDKANATVNVTGYTGTYDGNAHGASGTAAGIHSEDLGSLLDVGASFTDAPGGTANWSFAGNENYNSASGTASIVIGKANAIVNVSGYTGTYDSNAHGATGTATGVSDEDLSSLLDLGDSYADAPGGTANWSFAGNTNYNSTGGTAEIVINKAIAAISVTGYSGVYDGEAHGASGSAVGVNGENLGGLLSLGASFTNVPGGEASWSFAGNNNYESASGTVQITLARADALISVNGYSGAYDGTAHGASGTATGVNGEDLSSLLDFGSSFTEVPGGTANWSFAGNGNYNSDAGTAAIVISRAQVSFSLSDLNKTYNGNPQGATVNATPSSFSGYTVTYDGSATAPTNAGSYAVAIELGDPDNYEFAGPAPSGTLVIGKADATIDVDGYSGAYDGTSHGASGTATGVNNEDLSSLLNLGASFTNVPGGSANWTFAGNGNYNVASGSVPVSISKASANLSVSGYSGTYDGNAHGATGTATGVNGEDLGASLDLGASFTNAPGGTANWTFSGGQNYEDDSGAVIIAIAKADATINMNGYEGAYDGQPHGATGTATGVNNDDLSSLLDFGASFTNAPGGTANWSFAGDGNYNAASGSVAVVINKINATVSVSGTEVTFDNQPHGASGSATGLGGVVLSELLSLGASFTDAPGGTANWSFAGDDNYNPSSGSVQIKINKVPDAGTVTVSPTSQIYSGAVTYTATLPVPSVGGSALAATHANFYIGSQLMGTAELEEVSGTLVATLENAPLVETSPAGQLAPGSKSVTVVFDNVNPNFTVSASPASLTITPKPANGPATGWYVGENVFWTPNTTSNAATLFLRAVIQDPCFTNDVPDLSYTTCGDITKARVTFGTLNGTTFTPLTGATNLPVGYVDPNNKAVGTATASLQYNLQKNVNQAILTLAVKIDGYYMNDGNTIQPVVITVQRPSIGNQMLISSAYTDNTTSSGILKGANDGAATRTNVSGNIKYTNKFTNPQGDVTITIKTHNRPDGSVGDLRTYQIKTNAISTLNIPKDKNSATFTAKASIQDMTTGASVDGGALVSINVVKGGAGVGTIQVQVTSNKNGNTWFVGAWSNNKPQPATLVDGSISID